VRVYVYVCVCLCMCMSVCVSAYLCCWWRRRRNWRCRWRCGLALTTVTRAHELPHRATCSHTRAHFSRPLVARWHQIRKGNRRRAANSQQASAASADVVAETRARAPFATVRDDDPGLVRARTHRLLIRIDAPTLFVAFTSAVLHACARYGPFGCRISSVRERAGRPPCLGRCGRA